MGRFFNGALSKSRLVPVRSLIWKHRGYSTIDEKETQKFNDLSEHWWSPGGPLQLLHAMNPIRLEYIQRQVKQHYRREDGSSLKGLGILDIGCGGGILSEPLCRLGAKVTGIDAAEQNVRIAKKHAALDPSLSGTSLSYLHTTTGRRLGWAYPVQHKGTRSCIHMSG